VDIDNHRPIVAGSPLASYGSHVGNDVRQCGRRAAVARCGQRRQAASREVTVVERRQPPRRFDDDPDEASTAGDTSVVAEAVVDAVANDATPVPEIDADSDAAAPADATAAFAEPVVEEPPDELPESAIPKTAQASGSEQLPAGLAAAVREAEAPTPERRVGDPPPSPDIEQLPRRLEALLFVADHPVEEPTLALALSIDRRRLGQAVEDLGELLRSDARGIRLQQGPEGVQLVSDPEASEYIEYFLGLEASRRLSNAALETLAIIAYRQPMTRSGIDAVRGVNSDGAVATLRARGLIQETGRAPTPGRPRLFGTTQRFLEHFGLERASDLPPLPDDIELPPHEIGEQLGLDDAEVTALLAAEAVAEEAAPDPEAEISGEVDVLAETAAALASESGSESDPESDPGPSAESGSRSEARHNGAAGG
jgi:segregation and condensation protein B